MRKMLKCGAVNPDVADTYVFVNPVADAGAIRVGMSGTAITLVAASPRPGAPAEYPVGEGYRVEFPLVDVPRVSEWLLAQFRGTVVEDPAQDPSEVTSFRARLHDGTDHFIWSAGTWSVVADVDADWNSLEEVAHGLVDWDPATPFGIVVELQTTDRRFTPILRGYDLMYSIDLPDEFSDWLYGALVGGMSDDIRPEKDILVRSDGTSTIAFGDVEARIEDKWEFEDVVAVFNETDDPNHRTDIFASFDAGSRHITLTEPPASNDAILIRATYAPVVAVTTDQDYIELDRGQNIRFERVDTNDFGEAPEDSYIVDEFVDPPEATIFPAPRHIDLEIDLLVTSPLSVDAFRLASAVTKWLNEHRVIVSPSTGERATCRIIAPMEPISMPDRAGLRTIQMTFVVEDLYLHHRDAYSVGDGAPGSAFAYGVSNVQVSSTVGSATITTEVGG